jgi:predicted MFS family arabinose efflux permease
MISMLFGGLSLSHFGVGTSLLLCEALVLLGVFLIFFAARKQRTAEQI